MSDPSRNGPSRLSFLPDDSSTFPAPEDSLPGGFGPVSTPRVCKRHPEILVGPRVDPHPVMHPPARQLVLLRQHPPPTRDDPDVDPRVKFPVRPGHPHRPVRHPREPDVDGLRQLHHPSVRHLRQFPASTLPSRPVSRTRPPSVPGALPVVTGGEGLLPGPHGAHVTSGIHPYDSALRSDTLCHHLGS